jgi:hypothetical protein
MGFLLYNVEESGGQACLTLVRKLKIIGVNGPLTQWLRSQGTSEPTLKWELSGERLIGALAPDVDPKTHRIVMDMMPERLAGASLCHVLSLAGQSEADETDMVIVMRELNLVTQPAYGTDIRHTFLCSLNEESSDLIESMGVTGGTRRGTYRWCAPRMNIGAAVYRARPTALQHN